MQTLIINWLEFNNIERKIDERLEVTSLEGEIFCAFLDLNGDRAPGLDGLDF